MEVFMSKIPLARRKMAEFIFEALQHGPQLSYVLLNYVKENNLSMATFTRARRDMGIITYHDSEHGAWAMKLPELPTLLVTITNFDTGVKTITEREVPFEWRSFFKYTHK